MIRGRFLKQLAVVAVLVVTSTAASAQAAHANETSPTVSASTADKSWPPPPPPGTVLANGNGKVVPGAGHSAQVAWGCEYGYPCLYDLDNGLGSGLVLEGCGWWYLDDWIVVDSSTGGLRLADDWANSARTQGNSITVYNWTGGAWDDWGTVPAYQYWNFQLKNQIDAVHVNCASTPAPRL